MSIAITRRGFFDRVFLGITIEGADVRIGAAIGMAVSGHGSTADGLIKDADGAMYAAKATGRWFAMRAAMVPQHAN